MDIKRILIITLSNIGDVILTTPVVEAVLEQFKEAKLDIVVGPAALEIFRAHKKISEIIIYDKRASTLEKLIFIKKLHSKHYDMAIDLKNTAIPYLVGARIRSRSLGRIKNSLHKKFQHLSIAQALGINTEGAKLNIKLGDRDIAKIDEELKHIKGKFAVISCGAKSHTKRWPISYFALLCDNIRNNLGYEVLLVGKEEEVSPDSDRIVIDEVKKSMKTRAHDFVGKTNIRELAALIKKAAFVVTNDSAPLHIASAVNTPTIAIFGPTDENKYGPLADKSIVLRKKLACTPCEKAQCRHNYECMHQISVDDAMNAVKKILGAYP